MRREPQQQRRARVHQLVTVKARRASRQRNSGAGEEGSASRHTRRGTRPFQHDQRTNLLSVPASDWGLTKIVETVSFDTIVETTQRMHNGHNSDKKATDPSEIPSNA